MPNPVGRPTTYKEDYCEQLIEHMSQGFSYNSFAGLICVNTDTLYEWESKHVQFSEAKKAGRCRQLLFDEKLLMELTLGSLGKEANATPHIFKMKNCHRWTDRQEVDHKSSDKSMSPVFNFQEKK